MHRRRNSQLNPARVLSSAPEEEAPAPLRCPVSGCTGWVSVVAMKRKAAFLGCGECGSFWRKEESFFRDVTAAVESFPYRSKSYRRQGARWLPAALKNEAKCYEEKVEQEPKAHGKGFDKT
jgi:hypothetical protein